MSGKMFAAGVQDARESLRDGGKTMSAPDGGHSDWTRGWDSVIDGPEGEAWRAKVRAERGEADADCPTHGIERRRCGCTLVARDEKRDDLDEERLDVIEKAVRHLDEAAFARAIDAIKGLRRSLRLATDAARRAEQDEEEALKEERLRLVGLANAVLDAPMGGDSFMGNAKALARAVLDSKVLR